MSENLTPECLVSPKDVECKLSQSAQGEEGRNGTGDIHPRRRFTECVAPLRVTTRVRAQKERGEREKAIAKDPPPENPISQGPSARLTRRTATQRERRERETKQANGMSENPKPEAGPNEFVLCESTQKADERKESMDIAPKIPVPVKLPRRIEAQRKRRERERKEGKCKPKNPKPELRPTERMLSQSMQKTQERTEAKDMSEKPKPLLSEIRLRADEKKESTNVPPELLISQGATPVRLIPCMILQGEKERMEAEVMAENPKLEPRHTRSMSQSMQKVEERTGVDGTSVNTEPELRPTKCILSQSTPEVEQRKESRDSPQKIPIFQGTQPCSESQRGRERKESRDMSSENPKAELFVSRREADDKEGSTNIPPRLPRRIEGQRKRRERERKEGKCMPKNPKPERRPTECMLSQSMQKTQERMEAKDTAEDPKSLLSERRQNADERKESTNVPLELPISQGATPVRLIESIERQREGDRMEANEMSQNSMLELRPTRHVLSQSMQNVEKRKEAKDTSINAEPELGPTKCILSESKQKIEERKEAKHTSVNIEPELRPTKCMLSESTQKAEERKESRDFPPKVPISHGVKPCSGSERERERTEARDMSFEIPKLVLFESKQGTAERKESPNIVPELPIPQGITPVRLTLCMESRRERERMEANETSENPKLELRPTRCVLSQNMQNIEERNEAKDTSMSVNPEPELGPTKCMLSHSTQKAEERKEPRDIPPQIPNSQGVAPHLEAQRESERKEATDTSSENSKPGCSLPEPNLIPTQSAQRAEERKESSGAPPIFPIPRGPIPMALTARMKSQRRRREREKWEAKHTIPLPPIQTQYFKAQQYIAPSVLSHRIAFQGLCREGERNVAVNSTSEIPKPGHFIPTRTIYISTQSAHSAEERKQPRDIPPVLPTPVGFIPKTLTARMKSRKERRERERNKAKVTASKPLTPRMISQRLRREREKGEEKHTIPLPPIQTQYFKAQQYLAPSVLTHRTTFRGLCREGERNVAVNSTSENPKPGHFIPRRTIYITTQGAYRAEERKESRDIPPVLPIPVGRIPTTLSACMKSQKEGRERERNKAKVTASKPLTPTMISQKIRRERDKGEKNHTTPSHFKAQQKQQYSTPSTISGSTSIQGLCSEGERNVAVNTASPHQSKVTCCASLLSSGIKCTDKETLTWSVQRDETPLTVHSAGEDSGQKLLVERKKAKVAASKPLTPAMISQRIQKVREIGEEKHTTPLSPIPTQYLKAQQKQQFSAPSIICPSTAFEGLCREGETDVAVNSTTLHQSKATCCASSSSSTIKSTDKAKLTWSVQRDETPLTVYSAGEDSRQKLPVKRKKMMAPITYSTSGEKERMEAKDTCGNPMPELRPTKCMLSQSTQKAEERKEAKDMPENPVPESSPTKCMLSQDTQKAQERKEPRDVPPQIPIFQGDHPHLESQKEGENKEAKDTSSENLIPELRPTKCMLSQSTQKAEERKGAKDMPENPVPESRPEKCLSSQNTQKAEERKEPRDVPPQIPIFQGVHPHLESQREGESKEAKCTSSENPDPELRPTKCMPSESTEKAMERKEAGDMSENPEPEFVPTKCTLSQNPWDAVERAVPRDAPPQILIFQGVHPNLESQREGESKEAKGTFSENPEPYHFLSLIPNFMSAQSAEESKESRGVLPIVPIPRRFIPLTIPTSMNSLSDQRERERNEAEVITSNALIPQTISQSMQSEREKGEEKHTTPIPPIQTQYFKAPQKQQFSLPSIITRRTAFRGFRRQKEGNLAVNSTWLYLSEVPSGASSTSSANKCTES